MSVTVVVTSVVSAAAPRTPQCVLDQRHAARRALSTCAARCGVRADRWDQEDNGVPRVQNGWHWSISHKRHLVAAALAREPVGVDVESLVPRRSGLWKHIADADEWSVLGGPGWNAFYLLWTAKEAVLKAAGVGLAGLDACRLMHAELRTCFTLSYGGRKWRVEHFHHADHVVAVTCNSGRARWIVEPFKAPTSIYEETACVRGA